MELNNAVNGELQAHFLEAHSPGGDVGESTLHEGHVDVDDPEDVAAAHAHDHDPAEWYDEEHACAPYVHHAHERGGAIVSLLLN